MNSDFSTAIDTIIAQRRSIRKYKSDPVPRDVVLKLIEAARLAPSGSNRQAWRFYIVDDDMSRAKLRKSQAVKQQFALQAPVCIVCCVDMARYTTAETEVCIKELVDTGNMDPDASMEDYWEWWHSVSKGAEVALLAFLDLGIAVEHMVLAATAYGLGTCWMRRIDPVGIAEALSLPKDYMVIALLAVGFPAEQPKQRPRKPIETFIVPHDLQ